MIFSERTRGTGNKTECQKVKNKLSVSIFVRHSDQPLYKHLPINLNNSVHEIVYSLGSSKFTAFKIWTKLRLAKLLILKTRVVEGGDA